MGVFERDADNIEEALRTWTLVGATSEKDCESSLYDWLHKKFEKELFERQFWNAKTRADIFVKFDRGAAVAIEVKWNLVDRGEMHRLIGQTFDYLASWNAEVVLVLCGSNDPALVKLVRRAAEKLHASFDRKVRVVECPTVDAVERPQAVAGTANAT